mgnify:CR=1 FL=1
MHFIAQCILQSNKVCVDAQRSDWVIQRRKLAHGRAAVQQRLRLLSALHGEIVTYQLSHILETIELQSELASHQYSSVSMVKLCTISRLCTASPCSL